MQSSRRGFLGMMAGAAAAGSASVSKAATKFNLGSKASALMSESVGSNFAPPTGDMPYDARILWDLISKPGEINNNANVLHERRVMPVDLHQIKSMSLSCKYMLSNQREREKSINYYIKRLVRDGHLKVIPGMSDEMVIAAVKTLAGVK